MPLWEMTLAWLRCPILRCLPRETLTELEAHLHKLEEDHRNKQLALSLDTRYKMNTVHAHHTLHITVLILFAFYHCL